MSFDIQGAYFSEHEHRLQGGFWTPASHFFEVVLVMKNKSQQITLRLSEGDVAALDNAAARLKMSRSELARNALAVGIPFAIESEGVNFPRLVLCIEWMQASLDMIIHRDHADAAHLLESIAKERMAQFHSG